MKKRSKVYLKLFMSYLGVLMIPILIAVIIYSYILARIRIQTEHLNRNLLESTKKSLDKEIEGIQKIAGRFAMDSKVLNLSRVKGEFTGHEQLDLYYLNNDLAAVTISEDFISDVFVYFNHTQKISSTMGNMDAELYYQLYSAARELPMEAFREYMSQIHYYDTLYVERNSGGNTLLFTITVLDKSRGEPPATVGVTVNSDQIKAQLAASRWSEGMEVLILAPDGHKICEDGSIMEQYDMDYLTMTEGSYLTSTIMRERCLVTVLESDYSDWKYVAIMPISLVDQEARNIQRIALFGLFVCIVSGFAFSYLLTKRNYNPLKVILNTFQQHGKYSIGENDNEYQWLNGQIENFFQEHVDAERLISSNRKHLKQYYLTRLLQEYYDGKAVEQYGIRLNLEYHVVVLITPHEPDTAITENALQRFVILNIFEELCNNYFNLEILQMGERVAAILNLPEPSREYLTIIKEQLENLQQLTEESFGFTSIALVGPICQGMAGIHDSYQQACELEEYVHLLDEILIQYEDVKDIQPRYDYPVELERKILGAIQVGDSELAGASMHEVFERNLTGKVSPNTYRCLIYDLVGTLLKGASLGGYRNAAKELELPDTKTTLMPKAEAEQLFRDYLERICAEIRQMRRETSQDDSFSKKVEAYIRAHYQDPDLNVSLTSQYFDKTPAYLSSLYKKQTGKSLLEYINTLRMENAEHLLEQGLSVIEVVEQSGFRDSASFIRAFKKKKGITPGQLKRKF